MGVSATARKKIFFKQFLMVIGKPKNTYTSYPSISSPPFYLHFSLPFEQCSPLFEFSDQKTYVLSYMYQLSNDPPPFLPTTLFPAFTFLPTATYCTGGPTQDETSETTVRNLCCLYPYRRLNLT